MKISDAEWAIMNLIWDNGPMEAADVILNLAEQQGWSDRTVKTMLHRLVRKSALTATTQGRKYIYSAAVRRSVCVRAESRSFLDRVFGGQAGPALMCLVKMADLSPAEADEIRAMLDQTAAD